DIRGREQILNVHMRKVPIGQDVVPAVIARGTPGMSGADLANLCNEAALMAGRRNARVVEMQDFEKAKDKIIMGPERKSMVMRHGRSDAHGSMVYAENEDEHLLRRSVTKTTNISESTMQKVDLEVRRIIDEQYALARKLIEDNSEKMHAMAKALLEWETIDSEQIDDIMAGKEPRPPKDFAPRSASSGGTG